MKISKAPEHFFKLFQQGELFLISWLHRFRLIVAASPDYADQADEEQEPGHQERSKPKVEAGNICSLHNMDFANEGHWHRVGEEKEDDILRFFGYLT